MALFDVFNIAGSAMSAQSLRLNVTSSNLANADTIASSEKEAYRAKQPLFSSVLNEIQDDGSSVGVKVQSIAESTAPLRKQYSPDNPVADKDGYVYLPNVNTIEEMANMISASRAYQNNIEVLNTSKQLLMQTLKLGQ